MSAAMRHPAVTTGLRPALAARDFSVAQSGPTKCTIAAMRRSAKLTRVRKEGKSFNQFKYKYTKNFLSVGRNICRACRFQKCLNVGMEPDAIRPDRDKTGKQKNPRRSHLSSQNSAMYTAGGGSSHFDGTMSFGGTTKSTASSVAGELNQARKITIFKLFYNYQYFFCSL
jgi:hypothetical protein